MTAIELFEKNLECADFRKYFLEWLDEQGYLAEYGQAQEAKQQEMNQEWLRETKRLESKGVGDAPEAAWERVNR